MATTLPASKLVNINLELRASSVSQLAFGVPLIWDVENVPEADTSGTVTAFSSLAEMVTAGYSTYSAAYKMAQSLIAQSPRVPVFLVGAIDFTTSPGLTTAQALDAFTTLALTGFFIFLIADPDRDTTRIEEAAAWAEESENTKFLICAQSGLTIGSLGTTLYNAQRVQTSLWLTGNQAQVRELTFSADFASDASVTFKINGVSYGPVAYTVSSNETLAAVATAIATSPAVASAVAHTSTRSITVTAASPLVDLVFSNYAGGGATPTTMANALTTASAGPVDAAVAGRIIPLGAGEATMAEKTLTGIDPLPGNTSGATELEAIRVNYYTRIGGRAMTYPGTCSADIADGEALFADLVFGAAAFKAALIAGWLDFLMASKKVPYNDSGIAGAVAVLASVAKLYVGKGYLEPFDQKTAISFPLAAQVPPQDKTLRILNGITGNFNATGAIQKLGAVNVIINA